MPDSEIRTETTPAPRDRASLLVLGMAAFMVQADARVIDPLLHVIARDFHTSPPAAAIVISSYALPYGLFQLLYGPIGDRVGKIRVMAACLAVFSFGTFACAFVPSIPVFATLRFLTGVAAAAVIPMSLGYIGDTFPYQDRQIALGAVHERADDRSDRRQHAGRRLRSVPRLALHLHRLRHRLARRVRAAGARGAVDFPSRERRARLGPAILTVPLGGSLIFVGLLGVLPIAWSTALGGAGACLLVYALATQYGGMLTRPIGAAGPRHGDARRPVRLRRPRRIWRRR